VHIFLITSQVYSTCLCNRKVISKWKDYWINSYFCQRKLLMLALYVLDTQNLCGV